MSNQILIVDDDDDIREDLAGILREEGYRVETASNGLVALERLRSSSQLPDLILLDLMLPVMDGWHFRVEQLRDAALARIPLVVVAGAGDVRREAMALGAAGYQVKPFKLDALLAMVQRVCATM